MRKSLQLGTALQLVWQTTPILLVQLGVYLVFWIATLIYLAAVIGLAVLLNAIHGLLALIVVIVGLGAMSPIYNLAYRYVFYVIKAAHLVVMGELLTHGQLPAGQSQLAWGKQQVQERFGDVSVMFVADTLVKGVLCSFTSTVYSIASWIPGNEMRQLANVVNRVIRYATTYIDEAILARAFWQRDPNLWESAKDGIILYAMVWKPLLINAVALMLLSYVPFVVVMVLIATPVGLVLSAVSTPVAAWSVLALLVLAYLIKVAVGESFAMAAIIAAYHREIQGLQPDPAIEQRLDSISADFRKLKERITATPEGAMQPDRVSALPPATQ